MKIHILCNDGSPIGVTPNTIYGDSRRIGVGGAELALLTLAEGWKEQGHEVVLFNNPWEITPLLDQRPIAVFNPQENRDFLIIFRSPNVRSLPAKGRKIWWSCDQRTVGNFREFGLTVDQIVTISNFHKEHFEEVYNLDSTVIDLPIREQDYTPPVESAVPYRMLYSSVPERGLAILAQTYPLIRKQIPEVSLVVTADHRLWGGVDNSPQYRSMMFGQEGIQFLGAVSRHRLIEEQWKAEVLSFPCIYDELFCYAVAEAQYTSTLPITSNFGSLRTTNMGKIIEGDPTHPGWQRIFVREIVEAFKHREALYNQRQQVRENALKRFSLERILTEWDERVFNA